MGLARTSILTASLPKAADASLHVKGVNAVTKRLEIATTPNQDPLLTLTPIIGVDIWEHAFYLQYLNVKVDVCYTFFLFYPILIDHT